MSTVPKWDSSDHAVLVLTCGYWEAGKAGGNKRPLNRVSKRCRLPCKAALEVFSFIFQVNDCPSSPPSSFNPPAKQALPPRRQVSLANKWSLARSRRETVPHSDVVSLTANNRQQETSVFQCAAGVGCLEWREEVHSPSNWKRRCILDQCQVLELPQRFRAPWQLTPQAWTIT